jgi:hypothetical protein
MKDRLCPRALLGYSPPTRIAASCGSIPVTSVTHDGDRCHGLLASDAGNRRGILTSCVAVGIRRSIAQEMRSRDLFPRASAAPLKDTPPTILQCRAVSSICEGLAAVAPQLGGTLGRRNKPVNPEDSMLESSRPNNRFQYSDRRDTDLHSSNCTAQAEFVHQLHALSLNTGTVTLLVDEKPKRGVTTVMKL